VLPAKPGAFFLDGSVVNLFIKADGRKKWRTKCGTQVTDLAAPPKGSAEPAVQGGGGNPSLSAEIHKNRPQVIIFEGFLLFELFQPFFVFSVNRLASNQ
jgi:hypothetical protein